MLELIAHRGNYKGKNEEYENTPDYIEEAINNNFSVEIDTWFCKWSITNNTRRDYKDYYWFLGHDFPEYKIDFSFIRKLDKEAKSWCHAKNIETLYELLGCDINCFYHDMDRATLTSRAFIWTYPGARPLTFDSVCVLPEEAKVPYTEDELMSCYGVCSDYAEEYVEYL